MCSGCFRKGEKNMKCQYCRNEMSEGAKFCSLCGKKVIEAEPAPARRFCPSCGQKAGPGVLFCEYCGMRLPERTVSEPRPNPASVPAPAPGPRPELKPRPLSSGRFLMEAGMMSYYSGEPTVGIAKATGTLKIFDDRVEFHKKMGSSAGAMFGAVGMIIAANKMKQKGDLDIYRYRDVASVREGRYGGIYHTIVLVMKNGQVHSFAGTLNSGKIQEAVVQISRHLG